MNAAPSVPQGPVRGSLVPSPYVLQLSPASRCLHTCPEQLRLAFLRVHFLCVPAPVPGHRPPPPCLPWSRDRRQVVFTPSCLSTTGFAFLDCDCQLTCLPGHGHCRGTTESTHRVDTVIEACLGEEGRFHKAMKTWPHEG